jgi:hypothetical protein
VSTIRGQPHAEIVGVFVAVGGQLGSVERQTTSDVDVSAGVRADSLRPYRSRGAGAGSAGSRSSTRTRDDGM